MLGIAAAISKTTLELPKTETNFHSRLTLLMSDLSSGDSTAFALLDRMLFKDDTPSELGLHNALRTTRAWRT
jgi:hypothetical protein